MHPTPVPDDQLTDSPLDVLLIYPPLGSLDDVIRDIPLSLIYVASDTVKAGFRVKILDLRIEPEKWRERVDLALAAGCGLVGMSVMTGNPITSALHISQYIKKKYNLPIIWGGPHPTILPEQCLENPDIDYVVRNWGSKPLSLLVDHLTGGEARIEEINGLGYKVDGRIMLNEATPAHEMLDYHDLPYHLVPLDGSIYNRLQNGELIFPIYTSVGCPYRCTFCVSPITYKKIKGKRWVPYDVDQVLDHIQYISDKYHFTRLQIYDDDAFVDLARIERFIRGYIARGFNKRFKLDFRGARINELDRASDEFLTLLEEAGVELMCIGVESGSPRVLKLMQKDITVEQAIRVNQKLARHPSLNPNYNFFYGIPGEKFEDILETKELILRLIEDHPGCYISKIGHWKPYPGAVLTDRAVTEYGLKLPTDLHGWATMDSWEAKALRHPWYTPQTAKMIGLMEISGPLLSPWAPFLIEHLGPVLGRVVNWGVKLYKPILRWRLKNNYTGFLIEPKLERIGFRNIGRLIKLGNRGKKK